MHEKVDHRSQSTLKSRSDSPYRTILKRRHVYNIFKYTLILFNAFLCFAILIGIYCYFSGLTVKEIATPEDGEYLNEARAASTTGPKYAWLMPMLTFSLLFFIPTIGLVGAIKETTCPLMLYGVLFSMAAFVTLIFRSPIFIFFAAIASSAIGLVFLIDESPSSKYDSTDEIKSRNDSNV